MVGQTLLYLAGLSWIYSRRHPSTSCNNGMLYVLKSAARPDQQHKNCHRLKYEQKRLRGMLMFVYQQASRALEGSSKKCYWINSYFDPTFYRLLGYFQSSECLLWSKVKSWQKLFWTMSAICSVTRRPTILPRRGRTNHIKCRTLVVHVGIYCLVVLGSC